MMGVMALVAREEEGGRRGERERYSDSTVPTGIERKRSACCLEMMKKIADSSFSYLYLSLSLVLSLSLRFLSSFVFTLFGREGKYTRENFSRGLTSVSCLSPRSLMLNEGKEGAEKQAENPCFDFHQNRKNFGNRSRLTSDPFSFSSCPFYRFSSFPSFSISPLSSMHFYFLLFSSLYLFAPLLPYPGVHTPYRPPFSSPSSAPLSSFPSLVSLPFALFHFAEARDPSESHSRSSSRMPRRSEESSSLSRVKERFPEVEEEEGLVEEDYGEGGSHHSTLPTSFMNFSSDQGEKNEDDEAVPSPSFEGGHQDKEDLHERKNRKNKKNRKKSLEGKTEEDKNEKAGDGEGPPVVSIIRQGRDLDNLMRSSRRRRQREKQRAALHLSPPSLHSQGGGEKKKRRRFSLSSLFQWTGWNSHHPTATKRSEEKNMKLRSRENDRRGGGGEEEEGERRRKNTPGRGGGRGGGKGAVPEPPPDIDGVLSYKPFSREEEEGKGRRPGRGEKDGEDDDDVHHKDMGKTKKKGRSSVVNDVLFSSGDRRRLPSHFQKTGGSSETGEEKEKNLHWRQLSGLKRGFQKKAGDLAGYARQSSRLQSILKSIVIAIVVILVLRSVFSRKRKTPLSSSASSGKGGDRGEENSSRDREGGQGTPQEDEKDAKTGRKRILSLTDGYSPSSDDTASHALSDTSSKGSRFLGRGFLSGRRRGATNEGGEKKEGQGGSAAALQDVEEQKRQLERAEMLKMRLDSLKKFPGSSSSSSASLSSGGAHSHSSPSSTSSNSSPPGGGVGGLAPGSLTSKHLYREGKKIRDDIKDLYSLLQDLRKSNNELERQLLYASEFPSSVVVHQGTTGEKTPQTAAGPAAAATTTSSYIPNLGIANLLSSLFSFSSSSPQPLPLDGAVGGAAGGGSTSALSSPSPPGVHTPQALSGGLPFASSFSGGGTSPPPPPNASSRIATERKVMEAETQKQKALAEKAMMKNRLENTEAEVALLLERLRIAEGKINVEHQASESLKSSNEALAQKVQISKEALKNLKIEHEVLKQYARDLTSYSDYLQKGQGDAKSQGSQSSPSS